MLGGAGVRCLVAALACGIALSGCGGDDKPTAKGTPTATPSATGSPTGSPSASPSTPVVPQPKVPAARKGKAGQEAFARYIVDAWNYALETNDASLLYDVSPKSPCKGCKELRTELSERAAEGWYVAPFEVTVDKVRLSTSDGSTTASVKFDIPETTSMFDDGTVRNTSEAHRNALFTMIFELNKKEYRLLGFSIG